MALASACPIDSKQANEKVARVCSTLVIGVLVAIVLLPVVWAKWVAVGLLVDYAMRSFVGLGRSPLSLLARGIVGALGLEPKLVNAAPKTFAARIGLLCAVALSVSFFLGVPVAADAVAGIIGLCAFMEAALGFCVGCKIYGILIGLLKMGDKAERKRS